MTDIELEQLSEFQSKILTNGLPQIVSKFSDVRISRKGEGERFLLIEAGNCSFHIYNDAFDIESDSTCLRMEADDIENVEHAIEEFLTATSKLDAT